VTAFRQQGGRQTERFSEYFDFRRWPEKAGMKVTRHELAVILERHHRAVELNRFWPRFLRWLRSAPGTRATAQEPAIRIRQHATQAEAKAAAKDEGTPA
jgi:hypothetical protein